MNIFDFLERAQIRFPKKDALIFEGRKITYGEVYKQACCLSAALSKRFALQRGDRVAIFLPNIPEFMLSYYAVEKLGAIAVSLNVMLKRDEVEFILRDCGAKALITMPQLLEQVPENILTLRGTVVVGETNRIGCLRFFDLIAENRRRRRHPLYLRYNGSAERGFTHPRQFAVQLASYPSPYGHDAGRSAVMFPAVVSLLRTKLHHEHVGACRRDPAFA